jgi:site-specific recombinase XerD
MLQDQLLTFDKWQKEFINEKKVLNMSKSTIMNYTSILNKLYDYYGQFEERVWFYEIDRAFILSFLESLGDIKQNTKNLHITVIKNFFTYVSSHNIEGVDFKGRFLDLKAKVQKSDPEYLSNEEYDVLFKHLESAVKPKSFLQYRNRLIVKILLFTGIRASELLGIKIEDINLMREEGVYKIKVLGKGNKIRFVYVPVEMIENEFMFVKDYIVNYIQKNSTGIAQTSKGRVMARSELYIMIEKLFKRLGIKKRGVHLLRHTFGKKMVQKNVNLSTIKELMGHENIQTTMIYARSDEESMIAAIK